MESQLLAIMLRSRDSYAKVMPLLNLRMYSKEFQHLAKIVSAYYNKDQAAAAVSLPVIMELIASTNSNDKHVAIFKQLLDRAAADDVSSANVESTVLAAKRRELEQRIAISCVNQDDDAEELMLEYSRIKKLSTLDDLLTSGATIIERIDASLLVAERESGGKLIKIFPLAVNARLDGGALPGHHITVFARPEMGKSLFSINAAAGVARQGYKVLHIDNEDRPSDVQMRYLSNLSGMDRHAILNAPERAQRLAEQNGLEAITVAELTPGTPAQAGELAAKYGADFVVINQLRNLNTGESNKVLALEVAAQECRNIAKRTSSVVMSVTQAGESGTGKTFLEMGDVDFSNTGIPAACDVLLGIGADDQAMRMMERGISFSKNKIGVGEDSHQGVYVKVRPSISRVLSAGIGSGQQVD